MLKLLSKLLIGDQLKRYKKIVEEINALEPEFEKLSDSDLREESEKLRAHVRSSNDPRSFDKQTLIRAFALVREAAKRTLNQRHFDVQLIGGLVLNEGKIAEMLTGEGKTLAATSPIYLNALSGKGVHVITVNDYLAKRDTVWMGQIYHMLGLSVSCLVHDSAFLYDPHYSIAQQGETMVDKERDTTGSFRVQEEYLRPISRREAYQTDITYGTSHEFGFDYLRDNLAQSLEQQVQYGRGFNFAIIDEVDSVLIDEARTPLIIAAPDKESSANYKTFARIVQNLQKDKDYLVDEKYRSVDITDEGINKVERMLNVGNLYDPKNLRLTHFLEESLKAKELFRRDKEYVVKNNEIIIVDQNTGRLMPGRRYSGGLHQAIEAKEGVAVREESRTYASITIQNYFRMYKKLAGMTGTAKTSEEEFQKVYNLDVVQVPPNTPVIRKDLPDLIYKTRAGKYEAIIRDIKEKRKSGRPVLVGSVSIERNEEISNALKRAGIPHEILNAKNHEREGAIIAQAGRAGAVTVATNMAGRGVDIVLGGNPPNPLEAQKIRDAGGLHVIGTERHESRRIDNQLRGRSGRQGDPGSSRFFLSLEDDLMRIFGGEKLSRLMTALKVPEDMPIESKLVSKSVEQAQKRVEGMHFDARKHLLDFDNVLDKQRRAIYEKRQKLLASGNSPLILSFLDMLWMQHLENMEALKESVRLRAYGQRDPLIEYKKEGHRLYQQLLADFDKWTAENEERLKEISKSQITNYKQATNYNIQNNKPFSGDKIGRNDPCYCGSGKKYKKCHGV